jgi:hypothetical protein
MKYVVTISRCTDYEIEAESEDEAVDLVLDGEGTEIDQVTFNHSVEKVLDVS